MVFRWILLGVFVISFVKAAEMESASEIDTALKEAQFSDDVVVADAVFRGDYVGIVRMIQKISSDGSGAPYTTVMVKLEHNNDKTKETTKHMWHVEHDPITGVDCASKNTHFAPLGITKEANYTTYCSNVTPDFCEIGDISTKTTLTGIGNGVKYWYSVPLLPLVGPWAVIGHSVNIHMENMMKVRKACGNIVLNKRMTPAREVTIRVNIPKDVRPKHLNEARMAIARYLGLPTSNVQTVDGLDKLSAGCSDMKLLLFGQGMYDKDNLQALKDGKVAVGELSPISCTISGKAVRSSDAKPAANCESKQKGNREGGKYYQSEMNDDVVVADAVFRGVYTGVVRMIQKVTSSSAGYPRTKVIVRLRHAANNLITKNHMWHVEHDPIPGVNCSAENKHFAPYGITKQANYTTYCSGNTPDYCELGDISTKTGLTSVGQDVVKTYWVPLLPIVGPRTMIGHSVNVHGGNKSKVRQACGNIRLNTRMTRARMVDVPIKKPAVIHEEDLDTARTKISQKLGIPLSMVHTAVRLDTLGDAGCTKLQFLIFDRGNFCPKALAAIEGGEVDLGKLSPTNCRISRRDDTVMIENEGIKGKLSKVLAITVFVSAMFARNM